MLPYNVSVSDQVGQDHLQRSGYHVQMQTEVVKVFFFGLWPPLASATLPDPHRNSSIGIFWEPLQEVFEGPDVELTLPVMHSDDPRSV